MKSSLWHVHLAGGQKVKWALDEDLLWARNALSGQAAFTSLPSARIVHAAWWPALLAAGLKSLAGKKVVCFADNPPALYLSQPGFAEAAERVDLWIARSREALGQFQSLGLKAEMAPYCIDPAIFRPLPNAGELRRDLGIPQGAFVIGNFHRDSEGVDLSRPKAQKGPDILLQIAREVHARVPQTLVLLAGPRRHYLRKQLEQAGIPFLFIGQPKDEDDFDTNILDRVALNRLYQVLDVCVVSSRWEGGPYSILEGLFAGRPVLSTPVGMARDLLPESWVYRSVTEAADRLEAHAASRILDAALPETRERVLQTNSSEQLRIRLREIYSDFPRGGVSPGAIVSSGIHHLLARLARPDYRKPLLQPLSSPTLLPAETPLAPQTDRPMLELAAAGIAEARK